MSADTEELIAELRAHSCGCGGACGQRTPAFIAKAADRIAILEAALAEANRLLEVQIAGHKMSAKDATRNLMRARSAEDALALFAKHLRGKSLIGGKGYSIHISERDYAKIVAPLAALSSSKQKDGTG